MGLDVNLRKFPDFEDSQRRVKQYEEWSEKTWADAGKYEDITQDQRDAISARCEEYAASLGLGKWGDDESVETLKQKSALYPDHYFEVGYWRSSYNEGGINSVLGSTIGKDLYYIVFGDEKYNGEEYYIQPDWAAAQARLAEVRAQFADYVANYGYRATRVSDLGALAPGFVPPSDEREALAVFQGQLDQQREREAQREEREAQGKWVGGGAYSSREGHFFFGDEALTIVAAIPGSTFLGTCTYLIYKGDFDYYEQALQIVGETFAYVLAQPDPEKYRLSWSG